jgi:carbonic anhydrase/acetyltransferase-like protein (isoleucine patch superfamily)
MALIDRGGWFVAENATVWGPVSCARGVSIWYGAVVRADMAPISIGEFTNVQDLCVLHCDPGQDLRIGAHVTIGHMAMVHARRVGDLCLIGIHAILLNGCEVGDGCVIGAGALVREGQKIPPRSIVVGVPGRIIGTVDEATIEANRERAVRYYETALRHVAAEAGRAGCA